MIQNIQDGEVSMGNARADRLIEGVAGQEAGRVEQLQLEPLRVADEGVDLLWCDADGRNAGGPLS